MQNILWFSKNGQGLVTTRFFRMGSLYRHLFNFRLLTQKPRKRLISVYVIVFTHIVTNIANAVRIIPGLHMLVLDLHGILVVFMIANGIVLAVGLSLTCHLNASQVRKARHKSKYRWKNQTYYIRAALRCSVAYLKVIQNKKIIIYRFHKN